MQNFANAAEICGYDVQCQDIKQTADSPLTFLSKATGINYLQIKANETALEKYILKKTSNKVDITIKAKSAKALKNGEFVQISAKAPQLAYKNYSVSDFNAQTLCPYNKFLKKGSSYSFPYDIPAEFSAVITNDDLTKANAELSKNDNNRIKMNVLGVNVGNIIVEKCYVQNSKINADIKVSVPFVSTKTTVSASLAVKDGQLVFEDMTSDKISINLNNFLPQILQNTPLFFMFDMSKNTKGMVHIGEIKMLDDKIYVKGMFIIPKNCDITE